MNRTATMNGTVERSQELRAGGGRQALRTGVVGVLSAGLLLCGGALAANSATPASVTSTTAAAAVGLDASATPSPAPSAGTQGAAMEASGTHRFSGRPAARLALRFFINGDSSKPGFGLRAVKAAELILDRHSRALAKLPEALQADLKALKNAAEGDRVAAATKIKDSALNGGYGEKIQKLALQIQSHKAAK
ncbi:hypothetical protein [Pseudarthrobacter sp. N5]|uniref:hypothetical protein n=1 Tax=Pseudarthrobacter sp. N5 TaxID=3418416 RepID=UPI003CF229FC